MNELRLLACAVLLNAGVAAVVGAGIARHMLDGVPAIASVRLTELVAEHAAEVARGEAGPEEAVAATRAWAHGLDDALARVAEQHGVVLLPARSVAAGAPDLTGEVRAEIARALEATESRP